ncbi:MAG TPA: DUF5681 domain-containing protein [Chitinophagaceae bacterium]|nr:DUF5681 domain-containing protein [Chitinophagaceae bacterium]
MANPKNIVKHKFKKGQSGNPNGRPKKIPELDKLLAEVLGEEKDGIEAARVILIALRAKAMRGNTRAAEILLDRAYGKAKQTVNVNANINLSEVPITFE